MMNQNLNENKNQNALPIAQMNNNTLTTSLIEGLDLLKELIRYRLHNPDFPLLEKNWESFRDDDFLWNAWQLNASEKAVFMLALAPYVDPGMLDAAIRSALPEAGDFPELGGWRGKQHRGFLPTGETAIYLVSGDNVDQRSEAMSIFSPSHIFAKKRILWLEDAPQGEPLLAGRLVLNPEVVEQITLGEVQVPRFGKDFPAERIETALGWKDLIVGPGTRQDLAYIFSWLKHRQTLLEDERLGRRIAPGFRALFHGPPGTGKTLAASLLGKKASKPVYRVDLASVVSKYIGETEKNLSGLFARAEDKDWILFFDEADALFGKRTNVKEAKDRFANQEVSYLLQRVERYPGLVILASNYKSNIDDAFLRRFQSIVHFPMPGPNERLKIWKAGMPLSIPLAKDIDLDSIARDYELSGADIMQAIHYASVQAMMRDDKTIQYGDLITGIRREFRKAGKI